MPNPEHAETPPDEMGRVDDAVRKALRLDEDPVIPCECAAPFPKRDCASCGGFGQRRTSAEPGSPA